MLLLEQIKINNYQIKFVFSIENDYNFNLYSWTAYKDDKEILIPCVTESQFIENKILNLLKDRKNFYAINIR